MLVWFVDWRQGVVRVLLILVVIYSATPGMAESIPGGWWVEQERLLSAGGEWETKKQKLLLIQSRDMLLQGLLS